MHIRAIIHDWDDTITNSFESYSQFYYDFAEYYKIADTNLDTLKKHWGGTVPEIVAGVWPHLSTEEAEQKTKEFIKVIKEWRKSYPVSIFPQIKDTFKKLNKLGIKLGIVSSGDRLQIQKIYCEQISHKMNYHEFMFDNKDLGYRKPDPRVFDIPLKLLAGIGITSNEVIYVGDSFQDYHSAKNRGLIFFAVTTGLKTKEDFLQEGVSSDYILNNFNEILELL